MPVAARDAFDWDIVSRRLQKSADIEYLFDGKPPKVGEVFRALGQAEALRSMARDERDAFYTVEIAENMVAALAQFGTRICLRIMQRLREL